MGGRFRLTTWMALADFFSAIALVALALYGHQRHENIRVNPDVKELAKRIHEQLLKRKIESNFDPENAAIVLPDTVLFGSGQFQIRDPVHSDRVRTIGEVLKIEKESWRDRFVLVI